MSGRKRSLGKAAAAAALTAGVALASFGGTWAYYQSSRSMDNPLRTPGSSVAVIEDFNPNQSFLPGETAVKTVFFKNTGDMDLFLRVEVPPSEGWYLPDSAGGQRDPALDTKKVIKNWTEAWTKKTAGGSDDPAAWGPRTTGRRRYRIRIQDGCTDITGISCAERERAATGRRRS